jgi:hypothetical protein
VGDWLRAGRKYTPNGGFGIIKKYGKGIGCVWNIWATASVASKFFLESKCGKERIFIYTHVCVCVCVCVGH